jgi:putative ABC transport system substrate-binding protein
VSHLWAAFREGLGELGYREGQNVVIEFRSAEGDPARLPQLAKELVGLPVDVLVVQTMQAVQAARQATTTIPIVVTSQAEPVECGLVASLARPGGNLTGGAGIGLEQWGKLLELLQEIQPTLSRLGMLWNPDNCVDRNMVEQLREAAQSRRAVFQPLAVRTRADVEQALSPLASWRAEALAVTPASASFSHRRVLAELAIRQGLALVSNVREFADAGALLTYGPNLVAATRYAATYVDKILRGAKPGDLPMARPTRFELVINLKTAKALRLTIPPSVLARADELIQ